MYCPNCQFENPAGINYCGECGAKLENRCPSCNSTNPLSFKFCGECGHSLIPAKEISEQKSEAESLSTRPTSKKTTSSVTPLEGERKHVTVLFSDLTGYTVMSERLDPEEVKDITIQIFDEISKIISKYEGFIEKFAGDAVMALFGATTAHEDDPVRAISAAREIHNLVNSLSPKYEERIEQPLSMHTGINTGLVVTGEVNLEKGIHGVAGDAINVAARLSDLGKAGEIIVAPETYYQAQGYFDFKELEPAVIKGKSKPIRIFKVLSVKEQPVKVHGLDGLKAELIGRKVEMKQLKDAVHSLKAGKGSAISICGAAGTGKSRLVGDFKDSLNLEEVQWLEGHAHPYSQNIPYYPLINLLTKALLIEEGDPPEKIKEKVESEISSLVGKRDDVIPYIGSLFSLDYPEIKNVSPEFWKAQLQKTVQTILSELAQRAPTVICLEDIHWADPSFLELIRMILSDYRKPIFFLCIYRPIISLFTSHQINALANPYQEIRLKDLSTSESQLMVESLLKTKAIPADLQAFIHDKVEGNPFYIEEVINSLIESKTLVPDNGAWKTTRPIGESDISSTIHGVISGRLDRLEKETKRILQEASVIGRAFLYEILKRITQIKEHIDTHLSSLERLDLVKTKTIQPDLEYIFKHALTQEVVYNGLLKKERKEIHEHIGRVIEKLFNMRLPEFYETLAFHYKRGQSVLKAVDYLVKSGEKSLRRYAVEEAHQYYEEAFRLLSNKADKSGAESALLIDTVLQWCQVFYYRGDAVGLVELLRDHMDLAESLNDKDRLGMLYAWFGYVLFWREKYRDSYNYLSKALQLGEQIDNKQVIGYACTWFPYTCAELGLFDEGINHGKRAQEISKSIREDRYLFIKSLSGIGYVNFFQGERKGLLEKGLYALEYGKLHSDLRSLGMGHTGVGLSYLITGNYTSAIENCKKAVQVSEDPLYSMAFRTLLSFSYLAGGQFQEAEDTAQKVLTFVQKYGVYWLGTMANMILSVVLIAKGRMSEGLRKLKEVQQALISNESRWLYAQSEYILGSVYLQIVEGTGPRSFSVLIKNIGFFLKNVPLASKKAEDHFQKAIEVAKEIGAKGILSQAYFGLGLLHKAKKKEDRARECISHAIQVFEQCEAEIYVKQANEALESLR